MARAYTYVVWLRFDTDMFLARSTRISPILLDALLF